MSIFDIDFKELNFTDPNVLFGLGIIFLVLAVIVFLKKDIIFKSGSQQCLTKDEGCEDGVCKINPHQF